jgi:hypothetical protein
MKIESQIGDTKAQQEGVWITYPGTDGQFLIVYENAPEPRKFFRDELSKARRRTRAAMIPTSVIEQITMARLVNCLVKDWRNLELDDKPFPFTPENCAFLMKIPAYADFISQEAADIENFGGNVEGSPASAELKSGALVEPGIRNEQAVPATAG